MSGNGEVAGEHDGAGSRRRGEVLTVLSTKGGSGKSVVATNLAVLLARRPGKRVVLVDADLQFGDVTVMLKLDPQHTIVDVVESIDSLDAESLLTFLTPHPESGLLVLSAPHEPAFADRIGADSMRRIIDVLASFCDYVVVDTPSYFSDVILSLMQYSDEMVVVAAMDIPSIKNVRIGLQTLRLLDIAMSKVHLVLNRANSEVGLEVSDVERTLQLKAECLLPSDIAVPQSVNLGAPVVTASPQAGVSKAIGQLAQIVAPVAAA